MLLTLLLLGVVVSDGTSGCCADPAVAHHVASDATDHSTRYASRLGGSGSAKQREDGSRENERTH